MLGGEGEEFGVGFGGEVGGLGVLGDEKGLGADTLGESFASSLDVLFQPSQFLIY